MKIIKPEQNYKEDIKQLPANRLIKNISQI